MRIRRSRRHLRIPPFAIESAPLKDAWRSRSGQDYLLFADESFFKFFGPFRHEEGNFTHGVVAVPACEIDALAGDMGRLVKEFSELARCSGLASTELKFRVFRQLPGEFQARFVASLAHSLTSHAGFVAAFYTSVRGLVMERVRVNLLGSATRVPDDYSKLYDEAARELASEREAARVGSPGESWMIEKVVLSPVAGLTHFAASVGFRIRFVYDPRTSDHGEDAHVASNVLGWMEAWTKRIDPSLAGALLGFGYSVASHESLGLQLADVVAGEARQLFTRTPSLLRVGRTSALITETSREHHSVYWPVDDMLLKNGRVLKIPAATRRALFTPKPGRLFPLLNPLLASGILTCITDFGLLRHVMPYEGVFLDGLD